MAQRAALAAGVLALCLGAAREAAAQHSASGALTGGAQPGAGESGGARRDPIRLGSGRFERGGGDSVSWSDDWRGFGVGHGALMGVAVTSAAAAYAIGPDADSVWSRRFGVDEAARDALRGRSRRARLVARDASDLSLTLAVSHTVLVDAVILTGWYRDSPDVALQLTLISMEALAFTSALQTLSNLVSSRERPYVRECGADVPELAGDCVQDNQHRSFFSGHTSLAFAAASVGCVHRTKVPIYGQGSALAPCALGFGLAAATGALRMVADYHYFSDVAVGALVGTAVGLGVPLVLHYRSPDPQGVSLALAPSPGGAGLLGVF
ncbi:MAG: phosphatase PAP2 family protein [Polyangiaceae bacterium]|nr:phosphatase PAP2 family protein [Polyangiaceae bacterium]MCW5789877.1 phosphatase PAP2 family protein [Polyangiaceae bacterium]